MTRKSFLRQSLSICSMLGLSYYLTDSAPAWAAVKAQLKLIRWTYKTTNKGQKYLRIRIDTTAKCEVRRLQEGQFVKILIKNCDAAQQAGTLAGDGQIASSIEITQVEEHTQISVQINSAKGTIESRCTVNAGQAESEPQRIQVDIGAISAPNALKESNLGIEETHLDFGPLEMRPATKLIVIHHVGSTDEDVSAAEIHKWHLAQGWSGIGYHYVIRKNGTIERGRPLDAIGAHAYQYNDYSVGVCLVGNFNESQPTAAQLKSAARLIAVLCNFYELEADGFTVLGHRDLMDTDCPGQNLYDQLQSLIDKALEYQQN